MLDPVQCGLAFLTQPGPQILGESGIPSSTRSLSRSYLISRPMESKVAWSNTVDSKASQWIPIFLKVHTMWRVGNSPRKQVTLGVTRAPCVSNKEKPSFCRMTYLKQPASQRTATCIHLWLASKRQPTKCQPHRGRTFCDKSAYSIRATSLPSSNRLSPSGAPRLELRDLTGQLLLLCLQHLAREKRHNIPTKTGGGGFIRPVML